MKMRKNAGLTPLRQEGIARSALAEKRSRLNAASAFRVSVETAALRVGRFRGRAPPATPTVPRHCAGHVGPRQSMSPSGSPPTPLLGRRAHRCGNRCPVPRSTPAWPGFKDPEPEESAWRREHERPANMIALMSSSPSATSPAPGWITAGNASPPARATPCASGDPVPRQAMEHSSTRCLRGSADRYRRLGVVVCRVTTENGLYHASRAFVVACKDLGAKHFRTKPYTPRPNGGTEHFVQTASAGAGLRPDLRDVRAARHRPYGMDAHARLAPVAPYPRVLAAPQPGASLAVSACSRLGLLETEHLQAIALGLPEMDRWPGDVALAGQADRRGAGPAFVEHRDGPPFWASLAFREPLPRISTAGKPYMLRMDACTGERVKVTTVRRAGVECRHVQPPHDVSSLGGAGKPNCSWDPATCLTS